MNKRAISTVLDALPDALHAVAHPGRDSIELELSGGRVILRPVWAGQGFPRDLHAALHRLQAEPSEGVVMVARQFSRGARRELAELGHNWADETGSAWISLPSVVVTTSGRGEPKPKPQREGWTRASALIAETLLSAALKSGSKPNGLIATGDMVAEHAGVSAGRTAQVLQSFDARGYTRKEGGDRGPTARRLLADSSRLLSDWAGWHRQQRSEGILMHALWPGAHDFASTELGAIVATPDWAVTDWLAADMRAPMVSDVQTVSVYVDANTFDADLERRATMAGLRRVESGERVRLLRADGVVLKDAEMLNGIRVVSPIRLYGDLLRLGGRGEDAAEHLRRIAIGW
ncbi:transcriptional regulator with AbiEi antitoxin domain of type IV toxin-antitoxin system [Homoserinimonas aerilata]|uniref:Transcriptional regulator with AbiEi antitoxin domain of type IV toxin-antitoxin system n=1 Tax=Homoserinimonas aerilata TaxID=1162970 RepID=A0A542XX75_9MICO|nr:transcriptional regulator with AbiEi antitoxin domain of type IV toxin-antitoxin system [Homoserinimonas aerilata]